MARTTTIGRVRLRVLAASAPAETLDDTLENSYFSAPGEAMECVEIARRIHELAESGTAFDRIAILLRNPNRYQPLVEEALRRAAVPAYFSRGVLRPDPAGRAFLALLACASKNVRLRALPNTCRLAGSGKTRPRRRTADSR